MTEFRPPLKLTRGRHAGPSDGACLMELASLLAGEPWSDHPACVQPVLAAVARGVNDRVGDAGRTRLAPLAPRMIGTADDEFHTCARLVILCTSAALAQVPDKRHMEFCCELESARRTALWVLSRAHPGGERRGHQGAGGPGCPAGTGAAESARGAGGGAGPDSGTRGRWLARLAVALLDRARLLRRIYPQHAAAQAALAVAAMEGTAWGSQLALCELLEACVAECRHGEPCQAARL